MDTGDVITLQAPERIQVLIFTTDFTEKTDSCLVAIK